MADDADAPKSLNELCYTVAPDGSIRLRAWLDQTGLEGLAALLPTLHARMAAPHNANTDELMIILGRPTPT